MSEIIVYFPENLLFPAPGAPAFGDAGELWNAIKFCMHILCLSKILFSLSGKYAKQFALFVLFGGECEFRIICMANRGRVGWERERDGNGWEDCEPARSCFPIAVDHLAYANKTCNPIDKYLSSWQRFKRHIGTLKPSMGRKLY